MERLNSLSEYVAVELIDRIISKVKEMNAVISSTYGDELKSQIVHLGEIREKIATPAKNKRSRKIIYYIRDFISLSKEINLTIENLGTSKAENQELSHLISALSNQLQEIYDILTPSKIEPSLNNIELEISSFKKTLSSLKLEISKQESRIEELISDTEEKLSKLSIQTDKIDTKLQEELSKAKTHHDTVTVEINEKHTQINTILGIASSDVLSGDHGRNAATEEKTANRLRNLSVACMLIILGVLGFTVWESTKSTFSWDVALFRVSIAFLLSVPAAYLARESAKHREQQYYYRQTALNLKALSPYIASLPEEDQHKFKVDIASKIFAGREPAKFEGDSYPINIQEIMIALLSKIETPTRNTKLDD